MKILQICDHDLYVPMPVNDESKEWHEQPAIAKSNLKLILVFVKHPPVKRDKCGQIPCQMT